MTRLIAKLSTKANIRLAIGGGGSLGHCPLPSSQVQLTGPIWGARGGIRGELQRNPLQQMEPGPVQARPPLRLVGLLPPSAECPQGTMPHSASCPQRSQLVLSGAIWEARLTSWGLGAEATPTHISRARSRVRCSPARTLV